VLAAAIVFFTLVNLDSGAEGDQPALTLAPAAALPAGTPIRVHVAGAVLLPGVYELRQGDRLQEALSAAGGPSAGADTTALNLARHLRDGEQVLVPMLQSSGTGAQTAAAVPTLQPGQRLNLNTATVAQLDQLPGIGEAYSRRIVDSRAVDGPFASPEDLLRRNVLPRTTFESIRDLVSTGP
jgi:competence protein ComEA